MECPHCGFINEDDNEFCLQCHIKFKEDKIEEKEGFIYRQKEEIKNPEKTKEDVTKKAIEIQRYPIYHDIANVFYTTAAIECVPFIARGDYLFGIILIILVLIPERVFRGKEEKGKEYLVIGFIYMLVYVLISIFFK